MNDDNFSVYVTVGTSISEKCRQMIQVFSPLPIPDALLSRSEKEANLNMRVSLSGQLFTDYEPR